MAFNAEQFMEQTIKGANSIKMQPIPVGEYPAIISKVQPRPWQSKDGTSSGISLDVTWEIADDNLKVSLGRDKITVRQGVMLDLNLETGDLDMGEGRNVGLGRLREAVGKNSGDFSLSSLPGLAAKVVVTHRLDKEKDEIYSEVNRVLPL